MKTSTTKKKTINKVGKVRPMKTLLLITTQYEENYGSSEYPHWKAKGGQTFSLNVDADFFMYDEARCIDAINLILNKKDNSHNRYTYLSHELLFSGIKKLNDEKFEYYFNQLETKSKWSFSIRGH